MHRLLLSLNKLTIRLQIPSPTTQPILMFTSWTSHTTRPTQFMLQYFTQCLRLWSLRLTWQRGWMWKKFFPLKNSTHLSIYFTKSLTLSNKNMSVYCYKCPSGVNMEFPQRVSFFDVSKYSEKDLTIIKDNYYPFIMKMVGVDVFSIFPSYIKR